MPLYDYQCDSCHAVFEVERRMTDTRKQKCSACGSTRTSKVFNAAGVVFKGSGFYITDSKNGRSASSPPAKPATDPATPAKPEVAETPVAAGSESKTVEKAS